MSLKSWIFFVDDISLLKFLTVVFIVFWVISAVLTYYGVFITKQGTEINPVIQYFFSQIGPVDTFVLGAILAPIFFYLFYICFLDLEKQYHGGLQIWQYIAVKSILITILVSFVIFKVFDGVWDIGQTIMF